MKQLAELKDKFLRAQAEWDNSRKRIMREKEDAVRYAGESFLEKLLPVLDNFEMGMQAAKTATDAKAIAQGLEMVLVAISAGAARFRRGDDRRRGPAVRPASPRSARPYRI